MKAKEYMRLAKLSLKSRKKTTRSTVRGISFGLILLSPIIFMILGMNFSINSKLNKNPQSLSANVIAAAERAGLSDSSYSYDYETQINTPALLGSGHSEKLLAMTEKEAAVKFEPLYIKSHNSMLTSMSVTYSVDGGVSRTLINNNKQYEYNLYASLFDAGQVAGGSYIPKSVDKKFKFFAEGFDKGFTGDGKGQILLSGAFLKDNGMRPESFYGKKITIGYSVYGGMAALDNDNDPNNVLDENVREGAFAGSLCNNYEVVGIVNDAVTDFYSGSNSYSVKNPFGAVMFFSSASADLPSGGRLEPVLTQRQNTVPVATYTMSEAERTRLNAEYMLFGPSIFNSAFGNTYNSPQGIYTEHYFYTVKNYSQLDNLMEEIAGEFKTVYPEETLASVTIFASEIYNTYSMLYSIFNYASLVLLSIGGIIFFAAMVNLFNTVMHSVDSRKNYLGVMRAIGAKKSVIPNLYVAETMTIFGRAMIWILLFGGGICVGLKVLIDSLFQSAKISEEMSVSIGWEFVPITFLVLAAVLVAFGLAFAFGCSAKVASRPITEVLNEEN